MVLLRRHHRHGRQRRRVHGPRVVDDRQHPVPGIGDQRLVEVLFDVFGRGTAAVLSDDVRAVPAASAVVVIVIEIVVLVQIVVSVTSASASSATTATTAAVLTFVRVTFDDGRRPLAGAAQRRGGRQRALPGVLVLVAFQVVLRAGLVAADRRRTSRKQRDDAQRQQSAAQPEPSFQQHRPRMSRTLGDAGTRAQHDGDGSRGTDDWPPRRGSRVCIVSAAAAKVVGYRFPVCYAVANETAKINRRVRARTRVLSLLNI